MTFGSFCFLFNTKGSAFLKDSKCSTVTESMKPPTVAISYVGSCSGLETTLTPHSTSTSTPTSTWTPALTMVYCFDCDTHHTGNHDNDLTTSYESNLVICDCGDRRYAFPQYGPTDVPYRQRMRPWSKSKTHIV
jgi:hypothetical protein